MTLHFLQMVALALFFWVFRFWILQRSELAQTALLTSWTWGGLGLLLWGISLGDETLQLGPPGLGDQLWYLASLFLLGAGVGVLGARRPGNQVWGWFVVLPMVLVLGWPCLFFWGRGWPPARFSLMIPAFLGVCLVLVMSAGNYLGTRFTRSAIGSALACLLVILPRTPWGWSLLPYEVELHLAGSALLCGAILSAAFSPRTVAASPLERFWLDFRDAFGVVWTFRVQERLNYEAARLQWPFRFHADGVFFVDPPPPPGTLTGGMLPTAPPRRFDQPLQDLPPQVQSELKSTLTWVFRRFVDPEWMTSRLGEAWSSIPSLE